MIMMSVDEAENFTTAVSSDSQRPTRHIHLVDIIWTKKTKLKVRRKSIDLFVGDGGLVIYLERPVI